MKWPEIVFELIEDPMIESFSMGGLWDANRTLQGLLGMREIMDLSDEFICEAINASINTRNNYCSLSGQDELPQVNIENGEFVWKELPQVNIEDGEFIWEDCLQ